MGKLITQAEAAKLRGVSVSAVYYLIQRGRIRSVEKFGKVLVYEDEVKDYEAQKPGPKPAKNAARPIPKRGPKEPATPTKKPTPKKKGNG